MEYLGWWFDATCFSVKVGSRYISGRTSVHTARVSRGWVGVWQGYCCSENICDPQGHTTRHSSRASTITLHPIDKVFDVASSCESSRPQICWPTSSCKSAVEWVFKINGHCAYWTALRPSPTPSSNNAHHPKNIGSVIRQTWLNSNRLWEKAYRKHFGDEDNDGSVRTATALEEGFLQRLGLGREAVDRLTAGAHELFYLLLWDVTGRWQFRAHHICKETFQVSVRVWGVKRVKDSWTPTEKEVWPLEQNNGRHSDIAAE